MKRNRNFQLKENQFLSYYVWARTSNVSIMSREFKCRRLLGITVQYDDIDLTLTIQSTYGEFHRCNARLTVISHESVICLYGSLENFRTSYIYVLCEY